MYKVKLSLDELRVESFQVHPDGKYGGGTVYGQEYAELGTEVSCKGSCGQSCPPCDSDFASCTCLETCPCGDSEAICTAPDYCGSGPSGLC